MSAATAAGRVAAAIARKGAPVLLTRVTKTTGPSPLVNPPDLAADDLVVDGPALAGHTTISLRSSRARGVLLPGDKVFFGLGGGGGAATVTAQAASRTGANVAPGFSSVPVTVLPANVADGTAASILFAAAYGTFGMINSYPERLIDGARILSRDINMLVSADGIPRPDADWRVTFEGQTYSVVNANPVYMRTMVVQWDIQAR